MANGQQQTAQARGSRLSFDNRATRRYQTRSRWMMSRSVSAPGWPRAHGVESQPPYLRHVGSDRPRPWRRKAKAIEFLQAVVAQAPDDKMGIGEFRQTVGRQVDLKLPGSRWRCVISNHTRRQQAKATAVSSPPPVEPARVRRAAPGAQGEILSPSQGVSLPSPRMAPSEWRPVPLPSQDPTEGNKSLTTLGSAGTRRRRRPREWN